MKFRSDSGLVESEEERGMFLEWIKKHSLPFAFTIFKADKRTLAQNRLQRQWCNEAGKQLGMEPEEIRGYCKLTLGIPILRADNDGFKEKYDRLLKPLGYEQKLEIMQEPIDLPVTRLMTKEQKSRYLDAIYKHFTERGIILTDPET